MPKSESNSRPYNKSEKILAKGEAARKKAARKGKASGPGYISTADENQISRDVRKFSGETKVRAQKERGSVNTDRPGDSYTKGKTYEKGKRTKVRGANPPRGYADYSNVKPSKVK